VEARFFRTPAELREWLEEHHARERELLVGFYKKGSGRPSIAYPEALDQALCYGWIDGVRRRIDDESYSIRFTPRRRGSIWSAVNIRRVGELTELGLMRPAGLREFQQRDERKTNRYSSEQATIAFDAGSEEQFRANAAAWEYFCSQPPSYRRTATWWVMSARQEATRLRRLTTLIDESAQGRRLAQVTGAARRRDT
jgi:uncharacterized protein YdeI (YjbR/CyaY-like superfamily)